MGLGFYRIYPLHFIFFPLFLFGSIKGYSQDTKEVKDSAVMYTSEHFDSLKTSEILSEYRKEKRRNKEEGRKADKEYITALSNYTDQLLERDLSKKDSTGLRILFCHLGLDHENINLLNNISLAIKYYEQSTLFVPDPQKVIWVKYIETKLADIYAKQNQYESAIIVYNKILKIYRSQEKWDRCIKTEKAIGNTYGFLLDSVNQLKHYELALSMCKPGIDISAHLSAIQSLSKFYLYRNEKEFLNYQNVAYSLLQQNKKKKDTKYYQRLAIHEELKGLYALQKNAYDEALIYFQKELDYQIKQNNTGIDRSIAKTAIHLAKTYRLKSDFYNCRKYINAAYDHLLPKRNPESFIIPPSAIYSENTIQEILFEQAKYFKATYDSNHKNRLDSALICIDLSFQVQNLLDSDVNQLGSLFQSSSTQREMHNFAIDFLFEYGDLSDADNLEKIDTYISKSKNKILSFNQEQRASFDRLSISLQAQVSEWKKRIIFLDLLEDKSKVQNEILLLQDSIQGVIGQSRFDTLSKKVISSNFLDFYISDDHIYLSAHISNNVKIFNLGTKKALNSLLTQLNTKLDRQLNIDKIANQLADFLIPKELLLPENIIIIPDGVLSNLSFDLLIRKEEYLIQNHHILYNYNRYNFKKVNKANSDIRILAIAPNYKEAGYSKVSKKRGDLGILPKAKLEIEDLSKVFEGQVKLANSSILVDEIDQLSKYNTFHFAGHAISNTKESFLALVKDTSILKFGNSQIYNLPHHFDHITLSACETGLGGFSSGEAIQSLGSNFLQSGASSIIYSLWDSDDFSSSKIMSTYYKNLKEGLSNPFSLRKAKLDFINQAPPAFRHPYYWANFVFVGDSQLENDQLFYYKYSSWAFLVFGSLGILYFLFKTKKS